LSKSSGSQVQRSVVQGPLLEDGAADVAEEDGGEDALEAGVISDVAEEAAVPPDDVVNTPLEGTALVGGRLVA
jgi:hypothetical protein